MTKHRADLLPRMLLVPEIAELCQVSERTVWRWIRDGELEAYRLGRCTRISEKDFAKSLRDDRT